MFEIKSDKKGTIGKIHIEETEHIQAGGILMEIESNKGNSQIKSPVSGEIKSIVVEEGTKVEAGEILLNIEVKGNDSNRGIPSYFANIIKPMDREIEGEITIIGGGPGGYVAAIEAAKLGAKVVIVEKENLGGTCLNRGCIPTKAMVRSAEVFENIKNAKSFGLKAENVEVDIKAVVERKNSIVKNLVDGIKYLMGKHNITVIEGEAVVLDENTVEVKEKNRKTKITTKNIIIATGSQSVKLPIPGVDNKKVVTSTEILDLKELPKKLVIVGGGVIGMEFAFIFRSFGVEVSVVEFLEDILCSFDQDIINEIQTVAKRKGIKIYTSSKVEKIDWTEDEECIVTFTMQGETKLITADLVLMAAGRKPYFEGLGIENVKVELDERKRAIKVNEKLQTSIPNIYAIGDVTNKIQLAHVASHQGIIAVKNILGMKEVMDYSVVPSVVFTHPEIAVVGINEKGAKESGMEIEVGKFPFAANGKALTLGETEGFIKIIKDKATGKIIGASIIGPNAGDLIHELTVAIKNGLKTENIVNTIHAHPTTAEVIHEGALSLEGGAIHFAE